MIWQMLFIELRINNYYEGRYSRIRRCRKKRYSSIIKNTSFKVTDISEVNPTARDEIPSGINILIIIKTLF